VRIHFAGVYSADTPPPTINHNHPPNSTGIGTEHPPKSGSMTKPYSSVRIGLSPRKTRQYAFWDCLIIRNWASSPPKSDSPRCGTVTNQELVQPHMFDFYFCRVIRVAVLLRFCTLSCGQLWMRVRKTAKSLGRISFWSCECTSSAQKAQFNTSIQSSRSPTGRGTQ
jgi:hypothetical protein